MWEVIAGLLRAGVTIFLTTQYLLEADELAAQIAVIDGGRKIAEGTPAQLKQNLAGERLDLEFATADAFGRTARLLGERAVLTDQARLIVGVPTDGSSAHVRAVLDELDPGRTVVARFSVHAPTLDDVFLALTEPGTAATRSALTENRSALTEKEISHV